MSAGDVGGAGGGSTPWGDVQRPALLIGAVGLGACVVAGLVPAIGPRVVLPAYLVAYLFWIGIALGSLSLTMLHRLVGGTWGLPTRRPMEAAALTLPVLALLSVPLVFGLSAIYPWARADATPAMHKHGYLTATWFTARLVAYFAVWIALAVLMSRWSLRQDRTADPAASRPAQNLAGPGLGALFLTASFAMIDWVMSLEPEWSSTIYGAMLIIGMGLATFAAMILVTSWLKRVGPPEYAEAATPGRINDLGNLQLAFTMLWAYLSFSQFLIIWSGNLAEEIPWYLRRTRGGWQYVVMALMMFHFFAPFLALLFRDVKRGLNRLRIVALCLLVMHLVDLTWLVLPASVRDPLAASAADRPGIPWLTLLFVVAATAGVGGIWVAAFLQNLKGKPLVPENDPGIDVEAEAEHGPWEEGGH